MSVPFEISFEAISNELLSGAPAWIVCNETLKQCFLLTIQVDYNSTKDGISLLIV